MMHKWSDLYNNSHQDDFVLNGRYDLGGRGVGKLDKNKWQLLIVLVYSVESQILNKNGASGKEQLKQHEIIFCSFMRTVVLSLKLVDKYKVDVLYCTISDIIHTICTAFHDVIPLFVSHNALTYVSVHN